MENSIRNDAGKILIYLYRKKIEGKEMKTTIPDLLTETEWDKIRLHNAIEYCDNKGFIKTNNSYGTTSGFDLTNRLKGSDVTNSFAWLIFNISDLGIDVIEEHIPDSKNNFNIVFNFNNEFNIESFIKGEAKLF